MTPAEKKPLNAVPDPTIAESATPSSSKPDEEKSPAEIRAEIDETREELGDTVEALAQKTDIKAKAKEAAPESPQEAGRRAGAFARQNPRPLAIAGGALALILLWRWLRS